MSQISKYTNSPSCDGPFPEKGGFRGVDIRITEKRRLETAAPAIKHKMVNRSSPRVFLPVLPLKKGSTVASIAMAGVDVANC